jgi:RNA polymerase sigma-70 factor, ECF subfamily
MSESPDRLPSAPSPHQNEFDERQLVNLARGGDAAAFEQVLDRHQERVLRVAYSILRDPMDTEEVTQDVFLTVFEKIDSFRGDSSFSTWVHRITVNAALMRKRRNRSRKDILLEDVMPIFAENGHIAADVTDWSEQASDPALQSEARTVIQAAIDQLDEKYQTVFLLRDVEGFSSEDTAGILELSIPAVKSRLHRARLFLRRELADYFEKQADQ